MKPKTAEEERLSWTDESQVTITPPPPKKPKAVERFNAQEFNALCARAAMLSPEASKRGGWRKSPVDPGRLIPWFPGLRLKEGFVLRAYQNSGGIGSSGLVFAMPEKASFPEPSKCIVNDAGWLKGPRPPEALADFMSAIEGNGSAGSYLAASLLARELCEFGGTWHGLEWRTHRIIDASPLRKVDERDSSDDECHFDMETCQWLEKEPVQWWPRVQKYRSGPVTVTFFTVSALGCCGIYRHRDRFMMGYCRESCKDTLIAHGPGGYVF